MIVSSVRFTTELSLGTPLVATCVTSPFWIVVIVRLTVFAEPVKLPKICESGRYIRD